jgi:hypothetical protein
VSLTAGGAEGASSDGPPTGDVFAGTGSAPSIQVTISGRLFAQPGAEALTTSPAGAGASQTVSPSGGSGTVQNN